MDAPSLRRASGCILAELILCKPLFPGKTELEQLDLIFKVVGTPTDKTWPGHDKLPRFQQLQPKEAYQSMLEERYGERFATCDKQATNLIKHLLNLDASKRKVSQFFSSSVI